MESARGVAGRSALAAAFALFLSGCNLFGDSIEQKVVDAAVANYSGTCACPYSTNGSGGLCGSASAWSTKAPNAPICYPSEVTLAMIASYLATH